MHTLPTCRCRCLGMQHRVNYLGLLSTLSSPYQYSIYGISFYTTLYIPTQHRLQLHYHQYPSFHILSLTHGMSSVTLHIR